MERIKDKESLKIHRDLVNSFDYARKEGKAEAKAEAKAEWIDLTLRILELLKKGETESEISIQLKIDEADVLEIKSRMNF